MVRRVILLIVYLVAGYVLGNLVAHLVLIPVAAIKHLSAGLVNSLAVAGGLLGVLIGFGKWRARTAPADSWGVHGSARWANQREVRASLGGADGLIVGRENRKGGGLLRYSGEQHLITIAPTRSGKGVGAIIPNPLTANRSILCVDPKGENARVAVQARLKLGPVDVLDPFGVSGIASAAFNPLDGLDEDSPELAEDAALLADALVYDPPGQTGEAHWNEEAKALIAGVILYVVWSRRPAWSSCWTMTAAPCWARF